MRIFNLLIIIVQAAFWSLSDSLVTVQLDQKILAKYYRRVQLHPKTAPRFTLSNERLLQFCHDLRKSRVFQAVDTGGSWDSVRIPTLIIHVPASAMKTENDTIGLRTSTDFRLDNSTQILNQQSFQCFDLQGDMKWFITPAFIPESAFLFTVQPSLEYLSTRERKSIVEIPARLEAIIDKSATVYNPELPIISQIIEQSIVYSQDPTRDYLCNQHRIIQYRICAIAADASEANTQSDTVSGVYNHNNHNQYYWTQDPEENCRFVPPTLLKRLKLYSIAKHRRMLYCFVNKQEYPRATPFYLSLETQQPTFVVYLQEIFHADRNRSVYMFKLFNVPLLNHLDEYDKALNDLTF